MRYGQQRGATTSGGDLAQYAATIARMQGALQRICANKRAISESLLRSAAALRSISAAGEQRGGKAESSFR